MSELSTYAYPGILVETQWLEDHLKDPGLRIVESNGDVLLYGTGHIPGAVHIDWREDLQDQLIRDYIEPAEFAELNSRHGISPETTIVCRIGERSSHTWLVLSYLLGVPGVQNYDGSWTEWGNSVRVPIRRGDD